VSEGPESVQAARSRASKGAGGRSAGRDGKSSWPDSGQARAQVGDQPSYTRHD
jgi:hypothetical protein